LKTILHILPALALLAGCRPDTAGREARERELPHMRQALEAEQQGDFAKAARHYHDSLMANPEAASAHLGLAILLQEHQEDFLGAAYHYQRYLDLNPRAQKTETVRNRKTLAEQQLTQHLVRTHGAAASIIHQNLVQDNQTFKEKIAGLEAEKTRLEHENKTLEAAVKNQAAEIERQKRLLDRMTAPAPAQLQTQPRRVDIPDISNVKTPARPPAVPSLEPPPAPKRTYTVQPGDTLRRIAEKHYNDPRKWTAIRDANKDILGGDGDHLRVNQVLIIP